MKTTRNQAKSSLSADEIFKQDQSFVVYLNSFSAEISKISSERVLDFITTLMDTVQTTEGAEEFKKTLSRFESNSYVQSVFEDAMGNEWMDLLSTEQKKAFFRLFPEGTNDPKYKIFLEDMCYINFNSALQQANFRGRLAEKEASWLSPSHVNAKPYLFTLESGKAIRTAAANGKEEELIILLKNHSDMVNAIDQNRTKGWTALHWAIEKEHNRCVYLLLAHGARYDIADQTEQKRTAVDIALSKSNPLEHDELAMHIQKKYIPSGDKNTEQVLRISSCYGDLDAVKMMIAAGANIDSSDPETGQTALHMATQKKHYTIVECLIRQGADLNILDNEEHRPIDYADPQLLGIYEQSLVSKYQP